MMKVILIVDDEVDIVSTLQLIFEYSGFDVLSASNGIEALEILKSHVPDIILSDCMMPMMDGIAFRNEVRQISSLETIPFILMSGAPEKHDLENTVFDAFLRKPFRLEDLMPIVENLMDSKSLIATVRP